MRSVKSPAVYLGVFFSCAVVVAIAGLLTDAPLQRAWRAAIIATYGQGQLPVRVGDPIAVPSEEPDVVECWEIRDGSGTTIGVVGFVRTTGYDSPLELLVALDLAGEVQGLSIQSGWGPLQSDATSGSTVSDRAINAAITAVRRVAAL